MPQSPRSIARGATTVRSLGPATIEQPLLTAREKPVVAMKTHLSQKLRNKIIFFLKRKKIKDGLRLSTEIVVKIL